MAGNDKLIKELIINVKEKGLTATGNQLEKMQNNLENSAAGADLLRERLELIPDSIKEIVAEAKRLDAEMSNIRAPGLTSIENSFNDLEDSITDLIGNIAALQDDLNTNFSRSMSRADDNTNVLVNSLERLEQSMEGVERSSRKASKGITGVGTASEKGNRRLANMTRQGNNMSRSFSDIAKFAGPIPGIYAIIAANVFAASEAMRVLSDGAQLNRLEQIGSVMGASVGAPIQSIARDLQEATGFAISYENALRQAASASTFGFTAEQISQMTVAARRASVALGVDMNDALNRIIRGVSKLEIELLDELGITVRLTEAYDKYADSIGVSATALTSYQKQQAYLNAVLRESEIRQGKVDPYLQANGWERLDAAIRSTANSGVQYLADFLDPLATKLSNMLGGGTSNTLKELQDYSKTIETGLKEGGSSAIANAYLVMEQTSSRGLEKLGKNIGSQARRDFKKPLDEALDFMSYTNPFGAMLAEDIINAIDRSMGLSDKAAKEANDSFSQFSNTLQKARQATGAYTEEQIMAGAAAVKNAKSQKNFKETVDSISAAAKGGTLPFEQLTQGLVELDKAALQLQENAPGTSFQELSGFSKEAIGSVSSLAAIMRADYIANTTLAERQLSVTENGIKAGATRSHIELDTLKLETEALKVALRRQQVAGGSSIQMMATQSAININLLKEEEIRRQISQELLEQASLAKELELQQRQFNSGYSSTISSYDLAVSLNKLQLDNLQKELALLPAGNAATAERLRLEMEINKTKRDRAAIDAAELSRLTDSAISSMRSKEMNACGGGDISALTQEISMRQEELNTLRQKGLIDMEASQAKEQEISLMKGELLQKRLDQEAALNELFLARTNQQSIMSMNEQELLAYHQEVGASIYESSRNALAENDAAMGSMFDSLQQFIVGLDQVGKSSESAWNSVSMGIQAAASIASFASSQTIKDIDAQIAAEKKKDGKSEASRKKIAQLEAKKQKENIKMQRQSIIANTAVGIMSAIATAGTIGAGLALAAVVAAMGAMQLSSLESSSIPSADVSGDPTKLELGSRDNKVDVSRGSTMGELSYLRGSQGVGGIQDFIPRARGSALTPNVKYITGEHGAEPVSTSMQGMSVTKNEDTKTVKAGFGASPTLQFNISAIDSQSVIDRAGDIYAAVEAEANARGYTLSRLEQL